MAADQGSVRRHRILVVDDNPANRSIVEGLLGALHDVRQAGNGFEALEIVIHEPVDLVLLDVMMPGLSGLDVCRELKSRQENGFLPVILLTALSEQADRIDGLAAGADDFLTKPLEPTELRLRVAAFLRLRDQDLQIRLQVTELSRVQRLKDELLGLVLHDLRNPLWAIEGYVAMLGTTLAAHPDEAVRVRLSRLRATCERLRQVTEGILDVQQWESGRMAVSLEPCAIATLVADVCGALDGAAEAAGVRLTGDGDAVTVPLDRRLVSRAVENLVGNALQYSRPGDEVLVVGSAQGEVVHLEVRDRGPGVPEASGARIFERFATVDGGPAKNSGRRGYGLGLHLVKLVAEAHGGRATVHPREGGGTVFRITLPARSS